MVCGGEGVRGFGEGVSSATPSRSGCLMAQPCLYRWVSLYMSLASLQSAKR